MDRRWIFAFGVLVGAVLADITHPAQAEGCSTDDECYQQCLATLATNLPETECEDVRGPVQEAEVE